MYPLVWMRRVGGVQVVPFPSFAAQRPRTKYFVLSLSLPAAK